MRKGNLGILVIALLIILAFAGGMYLGSANKGTVQNPDANLESSFVPDEEPTPFVPEAVVSNEPKTTLTPEELTEINLILSDLPPHYSIIEEKSGLTYDPLLYAGGDPEGAQWLKEKGWAASHEAYFETPERPGSPVTSLHSTISIYGGTQLLNCVFQELRAKFAGQGGKYLETSRKFGDGSFLFLTYMEEAGAGRFPALQLRFYYGNAFVNLESAGAEGTISQQEIERLGTLLEQRLKEACPQCVQAPACGQ